MNRRTVGTVRYIRAWDTVTPSTVPSSAKARPVAKSHMTLSISPRRKGRASRPIQSVERSSWQPRLSTKCSGRGMRTTRIWPQNTSRSPRIRITSKVCELWCSPGPCTFCMALPATKSRTVAWPLRTSSATNDSSTVGAPHELQPWTRIEACSASNWLKPSPSSRTTSKSNSTGSPSKKLRRLSWTLASPQSEIARRWPARARSTLFGVTGGRVQSIGAAGLEGGSVSRASALASGPSSPRTSNLERRSRQDSASMPLARTKM